MGVGRKVLERRDAPNNGVGKYMRGEKRRGARCENIRAARSAIERGRKKMERCKPPRSGVIYKINITHKVYRLHIFF